MASPNLAGFAAAQERLRQEFGQDVVFYAPPAVTLPPGTPVDQFGRPLDPTITGSAVSATGSARCNVAFRAIGDQAEPLAAGVFEQTHVMLIANPAASAVVDGKETFELRDGLYDIDTWKMDPGFRGVTRVLVYGRKRGDA